MCTSNGIDGILFPSTLRDVGSVPFSTWIVTESFIFTTGVSDEIKFDGKFWWQNKNN